MFQRFLSKSWPFIVITLVIFTFHIRLFFPELSIYITPDYGRSDSWHLSIANKFYYAQELKKNRIPIWNPHIGTGYPTLAEGQTAIFFLPNLVFFRLLPFIWAYNLTLVLSFITAGIGTYLFCRSLNLNKFASTYAGTIFPLGGFFVFHVQHHNLLQTASIMPLLFWAVNEFLKTKRIIFLIISSLLLSQQIFAGFPQITFYSLIFILIFTTLRYFLDPHIKLYSILIILITATWGVLLSAIQVLPSYEFFNISARELSPGKILEEFPYNFKNLLQFLNPFILGSPQNGTYPIWIPGEWGIFWENTAYIGLLPIILAISTLPTLFAKKNADKNKAYIVLFGLLLFISLAFSLGRNTPFQTVFSFPPFSLFRVPSRFLLVTQFSFIVLSGIYFNKLSRLKITSSLLFFLAVSDLFLLLFFYSPVARAKDWLTQTETAKILSQDGHERIFSIGEFAKWNEKYIQDGWRDTNYYNFARNSLSQNSNLIFNINQFSAYESLLSERFSFAMNLVKSGFRSSDNKSLISNTSKNALQINNVSHIISPWELYNSEINKIFSTTNGAGEAFYVYRITNEPKPFYLVSQYKLAKKKSDIWNLFNDKNFDFKNEVILEDNIEIKYHPLKNWSIKPIKISPGLLELEITADNEALLIINESYYPGWEASVNHQDVRIYPANVNSKAVLIGGGKNLVEIKFKSRAYRNGLILSLTNLLITILIFVKFKKAKIP